MSQSNPIPAILGSITDAGSLAADVASLLALARMAAKEAWEAEHHAHNGDLGYGVAASPSGETHIADRVGAGAAGSETGPLVLDAGNDDWGTWTQILGSADTPPAEVVSATHFDMRMMTIVGAEDVDQRYIMQIVSQEDAPADDPVDGDILTEHEFYFQDTGVLASPALPTVDVSNYRCPVATKMWARLRAPDQNTSTISFYMYGHFYIDPDL